MTVTDRGYIKRLPADTYRVQNRGGKGIKGMGTREADSVEHLVTCRPWTICSSSPTVARSISSRRMKCRMPDAPPKGLPLVNLISLEPREQIRAILNVPNFGDGEFLVMATTRGKIKRTILTDYASVRSNGLIAIGLEEGDELRWVRMSKGSEDILLTSRGGQTIRFRQSEVRSMGRPASGVMGMSVDDDDSMISMDLVTPDGNCWSSRQGASASALRSAIIRSRDVRVAV